MDDEVPHNQRSGECILPILGFLINFSPEKRTHFDNIHVFGYWIGHGHPNMQALFKPIVEELLFAQILGVMVFVGGKQITSNAVLLQHDSDMRLKELILNHSGPTSEKGCSVCNITGETVYYASGSHATKFITRERVQSFQPELLLRTNDLWQGYAVFVYRTYC